MTIESWALADPVTSRDGIWFYNRQADAAPAVARSFCAEVAAGLRALVAAES